MLPFRDAPVDFGNLLPTVLTTIAAAVVEAGEPIFQARNHRLKGGAADAHSVAA